jgi:MYXO-CTERM domain-containing protein
MRARIAALAGVLTLAASASAHDVLLDYRELQDSGGASTISITACGIAVHGSGVGVFQDTGVGIFGGALDDRIDPGESATLSLGSSFTTSLAYRVTTAADLGGTSAVGEHFLEGFDAGGSSLGVVARSGLGWHDATALFGNVSLSRIEVTSGPDAMRIGEVAYELGPGDDATLLFTRLAGKVVPAVPFCGVSVTSSTGSVGVFQDGGVYAWTAAFDTWTNPAESLDIAFDAPVLVSYDFDEIRDDDEDFLEGEHFVEAFDAEGSSLGIRSAEGIDVDLTEPAFFGAVPLSRIVLTAVDGHRLASVRIVPEPSVGGAPVAVLALALGVRRRRSDAA